MRTLMLGLCLLWALPSTAGPMGFQGSWMSMGDLGPNWREVFVNYALTSRDAIGISQTYMRSDDQLQTRDLSEITYTRLLYRLNQAHAQSNIWFIGGIGDVNIDDDQQETQRNLHHKTMISPGISADYETRRLYFSATQRLYRADNINHDYSALRAGFSFYATDYTQTQPWLVIEARQMHDLTDQVEVTPMLRFINKQYFVEAGVNNSQQVRFNFMFIF